MLVLILIDVVEFRKRNRAASVAVYPFGLSSGAAFGIRGSIEEMPVIRVNFEGTDAPAPYALVDARAYDIAAGLYVSHATAKTHVSRLLMKLDARDRAQLVMIAYETGVASPGGA